MFEVLMIDDSENKIKAVKASLDRLQQSSNYETYYTDVQTRRNQAVEKAKVEAERNRRQYWEPKFPGLLTPEQYNILRRVSLSTCLNDRETYPLDGLLAAQTPDELKRAPLATPVVSEDIISGDVPRALATVRQVGANSSPYQLIISDSSMPGLKANETGGDDLLLRRKGAVPTVLYAQDAGTPVLIYTGGSKDSAEEDFKNGCYEALAAAHKDRLFHSGQVTQKKIPVIDCYGDEDKTQLLIAMADILMQKEKGLSVAEMNFGSADGVRLG